MTIKSLIDSGDYVIVLDTNVLLNIYRYSPDFSDFSLNCIRTVQENIILPATVRLEYGKHCRAEFSKMKSKVKDAQKNTADQIRRAKDKVLATCDGLERLQFPDIGELREILAEQLDEVQSVLEGFFEDRANLEFVSHAWNNTDHVQAIVSWWDQNGSIMQSPTQEDIYAWCEEGETRYKKEVPPGFKDAKNKDREIGGSAPSIYLGKITTKGQVDAPVLNGYLETHWINIDATRNDDFNTFIVSRAIMLLDAIATAMGKPISGRDSEEIISSFGKALLSQ